MKDTKKKEFRPMPQACANGIFAYRAISSVPMIAARMDATYTAFQICWKAGSASGARWLKLTIWFGFVTTM